MKYKGVASVSLLGLVPLAMTAQPDRPNVLVILADDYGWKDAGFMGSEFYQTPNLDRLAARSVVFTDGYSSCSVSSPSRASLLTGLYPPVHGITTWIGDPSGTGWRSKGRHSKMLPAAYRHELDTSFVTLPEVLKRYGYSTFMAGKWHLGDKVTPQMQGFDVNKGGWEPGSPKGGYFSPYCNPELEDGPVGENLSERLGRETAVFIEQEAEAGRPFFAYLSFYAVHGPLQTTEELWNKYRQKAVAQGFADGPAFKVDRLMPVRQYQDNPIYAGLVEQMDNGIGIVLDKIDELGLGDNTIIIFTSDNGGVASGDNHATCNLPLRGGKGRQWEGGVRVPYIIRTPEVEAARVCNVPVSGIDVFPTVLDYVGAEGGVPEGMSLRPLLDKRQDDDRLAALNSRPLFWHFPHYGNQGGEPSSIVRKGNWKLIWYHEDGRYELYNLAEDLGEQENVRDAYPEKVVELKEILHHWLKQSGAVMPEIDPVWSEDDEREYLAKAIPGMMARQEALRKTMMDPAWEPNSSWWGSKPFKDGWKFMLEDVPEAKEAGYDDTGWRKLDLPHDWAFENGFSSDGAQEDKGGYACGGIGWYRKHFSLIANEIKDKRLFLDFDGVYMNSEVWVNGHYLGKRPYGYISFSYDITQYIHAGENVLSVRVDNSLEPSARWYHGCGIYGEVRLRYENPLHLKQDEIYVYTPEVSDVAAAVHVRYSLSSNDDAKVEAYILKDNKTVSDTVCSVIPGEELRFSVSRPDLWSPQSPSLYQMMVRLYDSNGVLMDSENVTFGIRDIKWDAQKGFFLNGKQMKLRGVCEHLEGGPVGAAWTEGLMEWKLKLLKDMGCNAIRTAHNPQLPFFYDICDRLGIMVMDEAFDGWARKAEHDYGAQAFKQWWETDLRTFLRRDRNHPCVVIWSVGNETKGDVAADLVRVCHEEDPYRAVTSGHSGSEFMDVFGVNGHSERQSFVNTYTPDDKAFVATEAPHTWQVRGFYRTKTWYRDGYPHKVQDPYPISDLTEEEIFGYDWTSPEKRRNVKQIFNSSYDNATVRLTARHNIAFLRDLDWFSGHFRWTGFDYLGEAGYVHGGWPFRAFQGGTLDLAGFPKDLYYLYQSQWREDMDMVHILPHWTHPDVKEGTLIPVWVYTTGDEAELILNGRSLGKVSKGMDWDKMQCEWLVPWEKGTLTAVAYRDGKEICRTKVSTASSPTDFSMTIEGDAVRDDMFVTFTQTDGNGEVYPFGDNRVHIAIENGSIRSFENGNPVDVECNWNALSRRSFYGLSRAFIKVDDPKEGVSVLAGMICGDRSLKTSSIATIRLHEVVSGAREDSLRDYLVRYTVDGSDPDENSPVYQEPFEVHAGMKVKAKVYCDKVVLLEMEEDFGEGIYWGTPGEKPCKDDGMQAEYMTLHKAVVRNTNGIDVYGAGYVYFKNQGGSISWYQENDGGEGYAVLCIRYSQKSPEGKTLLALTNNGEHVADLEFVDTGSENKHWRMVEVDIKLHQGANNIKLTSLSDAAPSIDSIELH